jgi:DNA repair exonuclease SbcCD nuclease subunit
LSGHVHRHQKITEVSDLTPAYYIGSTERVSFNESGNENGFLIFEDDFRKPTYVQVDSASMRSVKVDLGKKKPEEINEAVKGIIEENKDAKCLQVSVSAEVAGDFFDVRCDWDALYPDFTILDVSVAPKSGGRDVSLERLEMSETLFDEYFEKTGLAERGELLELCKQLFRRYGT